MAILEVLLIAVPDIRARISICSFYVSLGFLDIPGRIEPGFKDNVQLKADPPSLLRVGIESASGFRNAESLTDSASWSSTVDEVP
jgi:hypothetical protein